MKSILYAYENERRTYGRTLYQHIFQVIIPDLRC